MNYWKTQTSDASIKKQIDKWIKLFHDKETRYGYVDDFLDSFLSMQIRVLRENRNWTQAQLGEKADMKQTRISLLESMNYSDWSLDVLRRLAKAFDLRLVVRFEDFGSFIPEYLEDFDREHLGRRGFDKDVVFTKKERNKALTAIGSLSSQTNNNLSHGKKSTITTMSFNTGVAANTDNFNKWSEDKEQRKVIVATLLRDLIQPETRSFKTEDEILTVS